MMKRKLTFAMKKEMALRSRRALLKKGSLGTAGVLGVAGAALLEHNQVSASARAAVVDPLIGVWEIVGSLQAILGINLPAVPALINGRVIFNDDGTLIGDSDIDTLPPLGGPAVLGYWTRKVDGSYEFYGKRPSIASLVAKSAGNVEFQGTLSFSEGNLVGTSTVKAPLVPITLNYTLSATRFGPPLAP